MNAIDEKAISMFFPGFVQILLPHKDNAKDLKCFVIDSEGRPNNVTHHMYNAMRFSYKMSGILEEAIANLPDEELRDMMSLVLRKTEGTMQ